MAGFGDVLAIAAAGAAQAIAPAPAALQGPPGGPADGPPPARSAPPAARGDAAQGPVRASPESAPPTTSAQTVEAPPPKVGAPTHPAPVAADPSAAGVTAYPAAFFTEFRPNSALDMIGHVPGFSEDDGEQVRGYSGAAGNVLIDGRRPASKSDSVSSQLSRINATDVDHIDLIRGGAPGIDMQGRTVMANVIRKKGDSTSLVGSAGIHDFADGRTLPTGNLLYSKRVGEHSFDATVSRGAGFDDSVGDGTYTVKTPGGPTVVTPARTSSDGGSFGVVTAYKGPLLGGDLRMNGKAVESYFKSGQSYGPQSALTDDVNSRNRDRQGEIGFNYDRKLGPVDVEVVGLTRSERSFSGQEETAPAFDGVFSQVQDTAESIGRVSGRYSPFTILTLEAGAEGAYNTLDGSSRYTQNQADVPLPSADVHVAETRGEFFGQATYRPFTSLTLEGAVRFETSDIKETGDASKERSFFYAKPRVSAAWSIDKDTQLRLRVEKKVGQLDFTNFVSTTNFAQNQVNAGNPDLRPDQRWQYEAALERRFWGKGSVVATVTHEEITDVVDLIPIIGPGYALDAPGNIGSGTSDTLDIQATVPLDKLGVKGGTFISSTTWRNSEVTDPDTGAKRRISSQRPRSINLQYQQDLPQWKSNVGVVYDRVWTEVSYRLEEIDHRIVTPDFLQVFAEYKPRRDLTFRLEANNLIPFRFHYQQDIYAGPRNTSALMQQADLSIQSQQRLYFRIRKVFQ